MKSVWMASLIGIVAVLVSGCGGTSEQAETPKPETVMVTVEKTVERTVEAPAQLAPTPAPASGAASSGTITPDEADIICEVLQECDLGDGSIITVTRVQKTRGVQALGETLEGSFVVVDFDYTYTGQDEPVEVTQPPFQLSDDKDNVYSLNFSATSSYGIEANRNLIYTTVQPGVTAPGAAVFQVSPESQSYTLLVQDLVLPDARKTAKIPL